ncbi:hypothetical protein HDE_09835 [Halotydeus destructor]|nr:hypothetical protein HDE_09835 [Halotydeus destructor]
MSVSNVFNVTIELITETVGFLLIINFNGLVSSSEPRGQDMPTKKMTVGGAVNGVFGATSDAMGAVTTGAQGVVGAAGMAVGATTGAVTGTLRSLGGLFGGGLVGAVFDGVAGVAGAVGQVGVGVTEVASGAIGVVGHTASGVVGAAGGGKNRKPRM